MNKQDSRQFGLSGVFRQVRIHRGLTWGMIILGALVAFEIFNFSTTEFALKDLLGGLNFAGVRWSSILAIAFCGIDFAGIARLFTPEKGKDEPAEVWYLFAAWLLAATMNAMLTWWGVSVAIAGNINLTSNQVVSMTTLTGIVPVFVAVMVWLIRVLIIGTFSVSGNRLFTQSEEKAGFRPLSMSLGNSRLTSLPARQGVHSVVTHRKADNRPFRRSGNNSRQNPRVANRSVTTISNRDGSYIASRHQ
ncbi:hypothetical protein ACFLTX_00650 [Chloroflexota bacterium]